MTSVKNLTGAKIWSFSLENVHICYPKNMFPKVSTTRHTSSPDENTPVIVLCISNSIQYTLHSLVPFN